MGWQNYMRWDLESLVEPIPEPRHDDALGLARRSKGPLCPGSPGTKTDPWQVCTLRLLLNSRLDEAWDVGKLRRGVHWRSVSGVGTDGNAGGVPKAFGMATLYRLPKLNSGAAELPRYRYAGLMHNKYSL